MMLQLGIATLLIGISAMAVATSPSFPPMVEPQDNVVADKIGHAVMDGDLREVQELFTDDLETRFDGEPAKPSKASAIQLMDKGFFGNWKKTMCEPVRIDRVAVSRLKIVIFVTFPGGPYPRCSYAAKANSILIFRLKGGMISNIDIWSIYG